MQKKYEVILTVSLSHEFYEDSKAFDFELSPGPASAKMFRDYKIIFKRVDRQYLLLQEGFVEGLNWEAIVPIEKDIPLSFEFSSKDRQFQNKTNIEFFASKAKKISITKSLTAEGDDYVCQLLDYRFGPIVLKNETFKDVRKSVKHILPSIIEEQIDLKPHSSCTHTPSYSGPYKTGNDSENDAFVWTAKRSSCDALISLSINGNVNQIFDFCFSSRSLKWRYVVQSKYRTTGENLTVIEELKRIEFDKERVSPNETAFTTTEKITLKHRYPFSFQVINDNEVIYNNLGTPLDSFLITDPVNVDKLLLLKRVVV
jgi:hypothetical protein